MNNFDYWYYWFVVPLLVPEAFGFWKYWWADEFLNADVWGKRKLIRLTFPAKNRNPHAWGNPERSEKTIPPLYKGNKANSSPLLEGTQKQVKNPKERRKEKP